MTTSSKTRLKISRARFPLLTPLRATYNLSEVLQIAFLHGAPRALYLHSDGRGRSIRL